MAKLLCVFIVVTSLFGSCFAEEKPTAKKDQQAKSKQVKVLPVSKFSMDMLESGRIDPRYTGYSVAEVIAALEKLTGIKRGEFESTSDYNSRKNAALTAKFLNDSSVDDVFAFSVPVPKGSTSGLRYEFNADTGDVNLYALPSSSQYLALNGIGAPDYQTNRREIKGLDTFILSTKIDSKSTYVGNNAYGASTTVEKTVISSYGIAANQIPFLKFKREIGYVNPVVANQFKLDNAYAAAELPVLKALLIIKLKYPYIVYNFIHKEPKRDSPTEISDQEKFLTGDVLGIIYYSGRTGEIFARLPETFGTP